MDNVIQKSSQHDSDISSIQVLADAVSAAIKDNKGDQRFIDLARIPLICLSISNISKVLDEIKSMMIVNKKESDEQNELFLTKESFNLQFQPLASNFRWIVLGVSGSIGIALLAAVLSLIIK